MPTTHVVAVKKVDEKLYVVRKGNKDRQVKIIGRDTHRVYVHYIDTDKRNDEWLPEAEVIIVPIRSSRKRKLSRSGTQSSSPHTKDMSMTEEDLDIGQHQRITKQKNFDKVFYSNWQMMTWYFSPYPLIENEEPESNGTKIPGIRTGKYGRTSDILAGGLARGSHGPNSTLWVCDTCFKYTPEHMSFEVHQRQCPLTAPPGRKVYQRGATTIYEVDGAKNKLYCQNLSLFGKLFIDVKTLFFDCDNFMYYILTDGTSKRDHVIGFFSKEKVSYDDYNLACIITFPPWQRCGFGSLMIEFSYELSRRAGKVGTPERPLSDLGLRSYLTYWVSTLIRFFRSILSVLPAGASHIISTSSPPNLASPTPELSDGPTSWNPKKNQKKKIKGWDGEVASEVPNDEQAEEFLTTLRTFKTVANPDGTATTSVIASCTLADIARATNLRVEDAAFALNEIGLLARRATTERGDTIVCTRDMIERVAQERGVKPPLLRLEHIKL